MKQHFNVAGMGCANCVAKVKNTLEGLAGVASAEVDLDAATATVEYDTQLVNSAQLCSAVEQAGYPMEPIEG
ncbi:MAG: heavy-metal-associated domain-containing protein [Bacteroidales bacterium]|nr:heavy-metal-associated domain-containing protein [Bacteroidales bacterium]